MSLDQQGFFWLSDPWVAAIAVVMAVGLLLWCHRSLKTGDLDEAVTVPVQGRSVPRPTGKSSRLWDCQTPLTRERRDAHHRRVA
jgi:hypothetical protein